MLLEQRQYTTRLIINADDFGLNESCTKAICQSFSEGLITDTTMVANGAAFEEAMGSIKWYGLEKKIGIHFNLTEGKPLTRTISSMPTFSENGVFHGNINRFKKLNKAEKIAVYEELSAQIEKLENAGIKITHADSHHHIHTAIFIAPIFARVCKEHGIKNVRLHRNVGSISKVKRVAKKMYNIWLSAKGFKTTDFFGSMEDVEFVGIRDSLEIMVHPDFDKQGILIDKVDELDGNAVGETLKLPAGNYKLRGYKDL